MPLRKSQPIIICIAKRSILDLHCKEKYFSELDSFAGVISVPVCIKCSMEDRTLHQALLNIFSCINMVEKAPLLLKVQAISLLFSALSGAVLFHAPLSEIDKSGYSLNTYKKQLSELKAYFEQFYFPLLKFRDVQRSYATKPAIEKIEKAPDIITDAPETNELIEGLIQIYTDFHGFTLNETERNQLKSNFLMLLRASVVHPQQFSVLSYYLTLMIVQHSDIIESCAPLSMDDSTLYQVKLQKGHFTPENREKMVALVLKLRELVSCHLAANMPSREELEALPVQERIRVMLNPSLTIYNAAQITYIVPQNLVHVLTDTYSLSEKEQQWATERWYELFYYQSADSSKVNKKKVFSACKENKKIGNILLALNTVLEPKNRIWLFAFGQNKLDSQSKSAIQTLYDSEIINGEKLDDSLNSEEKLRKMYQKIAKTFCFRSTDISLELIRRQCEYLYIDDSAAIDPLEESIVDLIHEFVEKLSVININRAFLLDDNYANTYVDQHKIEKFTLALKAQIWSQDVFLKFLSAIDVADKDFEENIISFVLENFSFSQKEQDWLLSCALSTKRYISTSLFKTCIEQIELCLKKSILSMLWNIITFS